MTVATLTPNGEPIEWRVSWTYAWAGVPLCPRWYAVEVFNTEDRADACIAGKLDGQGPQNYPEPRDVKKEWRHKPGLWMPKEAPHQPFEAPL